MNKQVKTTEIQKIKLDFEKLDKILKERKMSQRELSSRMGHNQTWVADLKKKDTPIPVGVEKFICLELGYEPGTFVRKERPEQKPDGSLAELAILENIYREIREERKLLEEVAERAEAIWNKLNTQATQLIKIKDKINVLSISDYEKALKFLRDILSEGKVLESEVIAKSDEAGIKRAELYKARRDMNVQTAVTGYGKNQKTWWLPAE
ncbi:MAG: hypothetical protein U0L05_01270 [Schaedlerella sp.]|nr:hypothetical protein [Schaedlerella sp.]